MSKTKSAKRVGFFCELPAKTITEIKRRSSKTNPQWRVIQAAIDLKPKK